MKQLSEKDVAGNHYKKEINMQNDEQNVQHHQERYAKATQKTPSLHAELEHNTSHAVVIKIYLNIPKEEKDDAKSLGAKWDNNEKSWYTTDDNPHKEKLFEKWQLNENLQQNKIFLSVPIEEKDEAKALGAKWDNNQKAWYTTADNPNNQELFSKWPNKQTEETHNVPEKIYLNVPREEKDDAKALGAKWDSKAVSWYTTSDNPANESLFSLYSKQDSTALNKVDFDNVRTLINNQNFLQHLGNSEDVRNAIATLNNAIDMVSSAHSRPKVG